MKTPGQATRQGLVTVEGHRKKLVVYVRSECHLCEDLVDQLRELQVESAFELDLRDVNTRPDWQSAYGEQVPVLLADGVEICRYFLDLRAVQQVLGAVAQGEEG
ncbi:MAG: glutaredoxin family protein [Pseudomonadota bacterium]|nr:glutaredoxin family protein [Pseudomonadota bacterium]